MKAIFLFVFSVFLLAACTGNRGGDEQEICDNGRDDDGDDLADCIDRDCADDPACACTPMLCADRGYQCGDWPGADGCGGDLACGDCDPGFECDGDGQCQAVCVPDCAGKCCGDDNCGGTCADSCAATGQVCGADCLCEGACTPVLCAERNYECGDWPGADGCGGDLACGDCDPGQACGNSGLCEVICVPDCAGKCCGNDGCDGTCTDTCAATGQVCGADCLCEGACTPTTCAEMNYACGDWPGADGCDGDLTCGDCGQGFFCDPQGLCQEVCQPQTCADLFLDCGFWPGGDGCSGDLDCGPCGQDQFCNASGQCEAQPTPSLVINELLYDQEGTDGPGAFIELWGDALMSLDGYRLEAVNGTNGSVYDSLDLDGASIGADGYFLVVHSGSDAELLGLADLSDNFANLQNGPDALRLVGPQGVRDLVGYGVSQAPFEGSAPAVDADAGLAISRDGAHTDTDDNAADFTAQTPSPRGGDTPDCNQTGCAGLTYCDAPTGNCLPGCDQDNQCDEYGSCDVGSHLCICDPNFHDCDGDCQSDWSTDSCGARCEPCPTDPHGLTDCDLNNAIQQYLCVLTCDAGYHQCGEQCSLCPSAIGVDEFACDAQNACVIASCQDDYLACDGLCVECAPGWLDRDCINGACAAYSCQDGYRLAGTNCEPYDPEVIVSASAVQALAVAEEEDDRNGFSYGVPRLAYMYGPLQDPPTTQSVGYAWTDGFNWHEDLVASDAYYPAVSPKTGLGLVVDADLVSHVFYINPSSQLVWANRTNAQWTSQVISGADQYSVLDAEFDGVDTIYLLVKNRSQGTAELFSYTNGTWSSEVLYTDGNTIYGARGRIVIDFDDLPWIMLSTSDGLGFTGYVVDRWHPFFDDWTAACWSSNPFDSGLSFNIDRNDEVCLLSLQESGHVRLRRQTDGQADETSINLTALSDWDAGQDQEIWNTLLVMDGNLWSHVFFNDYSDAYSSHRLRHVDPVGDTFVVDSDPTTTFDAMSSTFQMTSGTIDLVYVADDAAGPGVVVKFVSFRD